MSTPAGDAGPGAEAVARRTLRLGTRRSPLALHQAGLAKAAWEATHPQGPAIELAPMETRGDRDPRELGVIGDRGLFAHELEASLASGEIDAAVHSAKDLPVGGDAAAAGLVLAAWLPRADPRDALVGGPARLQDLPIGARVATGSARRMSALVTLRMDLVPSPIRGNVATRIERSRERGDAACMLAMAGLERLGLVPEGGGEGAGGGVAAHPIPVDVVVPEAAQGAVVVQTRAADAGAWSSVDDIPTRRTVTLERALAAGLGGGCERPVGVFVDLAAGRIETFAAPEPRAPGRILGLDLIGLEAAPLLSVSTPADIDDAADWVAQQLLPRIVGGLEIVPGGAG